MKLYIGFLYCFRFVLHYSNLSLIMSSCMWIDGKTNSTTQKELILLNIVPSTSFSMLVYFDAFRISTIYTNTMAQEL